MQNIPANCRMPADWGKQFLLSVIRSNKLRIPTRDDGNANDYDVHYPFNACIPRQTRETVFRELRCAVLYIDGCERDKKGKITKGTADRMPRITRLQRSLQDLASPHAIIRMIACSGHVFLDPRGGNNRQNIQLLLWVIWELYHTQVWMKDLSTEDLSTSGYEGLVVLRHNVAALLSGFCREHTHTDKSISRDYCYWDYNSPLDAGYKLRPFKSTENTYMLKTQISTTASVNTCWGNWNSCYARLWLIRWLSSTAEGWLTPK